MNNEFNNLNNEVNNINGANSQNQTNQNNMTYQQVNSNDSNKKSVSPKKKDRNVALIMMAVIVVFYLLIFLVAYVPIKNEVNKARIKHEQSNNEINNNYNNNGNSTNGNTNNDLSITYQGYKFIKLVGYTYESTPDYLKVTNSSAGVLMGINIIDGSYSQLNALTEAQIKLELEKKLSNVDYKITKVSKEKISGRDFIIADAEDEDGKFLIYITKLDETHAASGQLFDEYFSGFHSDLMYVSTVLSTVSAVSK
ncbi:unknown [Clostridium sp. CAG:710]|nr:unknown [Clostridium sp. CAG:710]